jgi:hypothetical protein
MKKLKMPALSMLLLETIMLLSSFENIKAQTSTYHPFPTDSAMWRVDWVDFSTCFAVDAAYQFYYDGDTVINLSTYHKIFKSGAIITMCYNGSFGYQGALREDTLTRKIYLVLPGTNNDSLLYDFSLNPGDTLHSLLLSTIFSCSPASYPDTVIVTYIDSVQVGSSYRKRWNFSGKHLCTFSSIIEGIGSLTGLIEDLGAFEAGGNLICFKSDSLNYVCGFSQIGCNFVTDAIQDIVIEEFLNISPNPFYTSAMLQLSEEFENTTIEIYNCTGNLIRKENIFRQCVYQLNRNDMANGIYFIKLINGKGKIAKKKFIIG